MLARQRDDFADRQFGRHRDRVEQHARLETLDLRHFAGLFGRQQILVDDPDPALLGHGDRQTAFGHRIHRGRNEWHVQRDIAGQLGFERRIAGQNVGKRGDEEHVIERECFLD